MKTHQYNSKLKWTGNKGTGTSGYKAYERSYVLTSEGKPDILGSSDPSFLGDPEKHNPEDLLVHSISACHMLWYLHLCAVNKIVVTHYEDHAVGIMEEDNTGAGRFKEVTLKPQVTIENADKGELAEALHGKANEMCFIARSCNFPIRHEPTLQKINSDG